ncbi:amino acid ABC transporter ATP-binding protein [Pantoea cypripedii]|uniref:Peptide ABC transporter ATP-binding protein n=1 Tax=Pantoea cypripedii TaxID=55209 RepID=A0A1X1EK02_PANCY|nr:amino acid ABC transporter ATP-binding protein [Pantoea cypripedii]MBP2200409.1 polar amino acid transport system ATP-binding protein [Pantoea cypripedii]ORM89261.1 peptide ABC transporter ATP-binding protein [Pantoea cypripedii]
MPQLDIIKLKAAYNDQPVLENVTLSVEKGDIVSLIGPSGSGKSTLLRVLMGLLLPKEGQVLLENSVVDYTNKNELRQLRESIAIVFQQYNLFQNMTVLENVMITPTKIKGWSKKEVEQDARRLLERVGLSHRINAYPDQLSGGQQQRVAIARALALKPTILLLDEVTAALDPEMVNEVLDTIRELASEGITMFIVSHEMSFVREVSSKVVFMADGQVVETGSPQQVFDAPIHERTRQFVSKILRH